MTSYIKHEIQPGEWEIHTVDGVFIKQMHLPVAGMLVPQHSHTHAHMSMLAHGAVRVGIEGEPAGDFHAPCGIFIAAGKKHLFESLEPDTVLYCIHNLAHMEIAEEYQLVEDMPCPGE